MVSAETIRSGQELAREHWGEGAGQVNVGEAERTACKIGGGVLLATGLLRGGLKGLAVAGLGGLLLRRGMTGRCAAYQAMGFSTAGPDGPMASVGSGEGVHVEEVAYIQRPPAELFAFWRDHANLPRFMANIESVTTRGDDEHSHWVARGPFGLTFQWDAEIHNETPGEMIAWRSTGGDVQTAGSVHFTEAMGGRGTEVRVNERFVLPGGQIGAALAGLLGHDPATQTRANLQRLKQMMEAGAPATA